MADHIIDVRVDNKIASVVGDPLYVCGNSDYIVRFSFDAEWADHDAKTARFVKSNKEYIDVPFTGELCAVPIISDTPYVRIGVYSGNLCTTTPAIVNAQRSILCGSGTQADPPDDVYNRLVAMLNEIAKSGIKGETGEITDVTASVDANTGTPSVEVTLGGTSTQRSFDFVFKNLKGDKGDKGDTADVSKDSEKLGGKAPEYYLRPWNRLDNSDFSNGRFIVQAGLNGLHGSTVYLGDRWIGDNRITAEQKQDHIVLTSTSQFAYIVQRVHVEGGKTYTLAIKSTDADCYLGFDVSGVKERHHEGDVYTLQVYVPYDSNLIKVSIYPAFKDGGGTANIYWAGLYEGAFTPKTLPPYTPKGYAAELAECRMYYRPSVFEQVVGIVNQHGNVWYISIPMDGEMDHTPSLESFRIVYLGGESGEVNGGGLPNYTVAHYRSDKRCLSVIIAFASDYPKAFTNAIDVGYMGIEYALNADLS